MRGYTAILELTIVFSSPKENVRSTCNSSMQHMNRRNNKFLKVPKTWMKHNLKISVNLQCQSSNQAFCNPLRIFPLVSPFWILQLALVNPLWQLNKVVSYLLAWPSGTEYRNIQDQIIKQATVHNWPERVQEHTENKNIFKHATR